MEISKKVLPESMGFSMVSTIVVLLKSRDSPPCYMSTEYVKVDQSQLMQTFMTLFSAKMSITFVAQCATFLLGY